MQMRNADVIECDEQQEPKKMYLKISRMCSVDFPNSERLLNNI